MKILAIETSCDETAVALLEAEGTLPAVSFQVRGNALYSQAEKHAAYGGVYPNLAKREHSANLVPLLDAALTEARWSVADTTPITETQYTFLEELLMREPALLAALTGYCATHGAPDIDAIAVTHGPGLEPALWVGVNFARALAALWDVPIIPVNHLEGHMVASVVHEEEGVYSVVSPGFPMLGLILSGGHTEFVLAKDWGSYQVVGATRDDSIGEAFDKVARLLGIPYPGGPGISKLAAKHRSDSATNMVQRAVSIPELPRPMATADNLDFSFSGLKTAVLYLVRDLGELTEPQRAAVAAEFETAVGDVVVAKTKRALVTHPAHTFVIGGGVTANRYIRKRLQELFEIERYDTTLTLPAPDLSTDNAIMIGMAGYLVHLRGEPALSWSDELRASGTLSVDPNRTRNERL